MIIGSKIYYFDSIESTNAYAKTLIGKTPEGTVIIADEQTAGKGRSDREWYSPAGGLWMSVIVKPSSFNLLAIAAGVAICEALHIHGILPGLKWPNDIMLNRKKIGGILIDIVDDHAAIGIGLNLNIRAFPDWLVNKASSVFIETKKLLDLKTVQEIVFKELDGCYMMLKNRREPDLLTKWRHYTIILGQQVAVELGGVRIRGRVIDINNDGALVIMTSDQKIERVISGECEML